MTLFKLEINTSILCTVNQDLVSRSPCLLCWVAPMRDLPSQMSHFSAAGCWGPCELPGRSKASVACGSAGTAQDLGGRRRPTRLCVWPAATCCAVGLSGVEARTPRVLPDPEPWPVSERRLPAAWGLEASPGTAHPWVCGRFTDSGPAH